MHATEDMSPQNLSSVSPSGSSSVSSASSEPTQPIYPSANTSPLSLAFCDGLLPSMLEEYIALCHPVQETEEAKSRSRVSSNPSGRFPNLAGFCRFIGCSTEEWLAFEQEYPVPFGRLRAVLEDEALNASLSPTVIGAYLKKRLGYDKESDARGSESLTVRFEHDIWEDGE